MRTPEDRARVQFSLPTLTLSIGGALVLSLISLWPHHVDTPLRSEVDDIITQLNNLNLGIKLSYSDAERISNILLYVPVGILIAHVTRARGKLARLGTLLIPLLISATVEAAQTFLLPDRTGDKIDILTNTLGASAGWLMYQLYKSATDKYPDTTSATHIHHGAASQPRAKGTNP